MQGISQELADQKKRKILVIISGPTCAGKDSVVKWLLRHNRNMVRLVTTNSRTRRKEEKEGVDYFFVSKKEFEDLIAQEAFFEWVEYRGDYRGTQKKHVKEFIASGKDVVWRIDVRGVKNIYERVKDEIPHSVFIFLGEELAVLEQRMKRRATEDRRWQDWSASRAKWELAQFGDFDYVVFNKQGKLKHAVEIVEAIIEAKRREVRE